MPQKQTVLLKEMVEHKRISDELEVSSRTTNERQFDTNATKAFIAGSHIVCSKGKM